MRGRTLYKRVTKPEFQISIHSLVRGRTIISPLGSIKPYIHFNPLPRERENPLGLRVDKPIWWFQSTPSWEGELFFKRLLSNGRYFNPLPRERENSTIRKLRGCTAGYFNPLPRERENQTRIHISDSNMFISIHSLVRGRTLSHLHGKFDRYQISIHSLVRGRTRELLGV